MCRVLQHRRREARPGARDDPLVLPTIIYCYCFRGLEGQRGGTGGAIRVSAMFKIGAALLPGRSASHERNRNVIAVDRLPAWGFEENVGQGRILRHEHALSLMLMQKIFP